MVFSYFLKSSLSSFRRKSESRSIRTIWIPGLRRNDAMADGVKNQKPQKFDNKVGAYD